MRFKRLKLLSAWNRRMRHIASENDGLGIGGAAATPVAGRQRALDRYRKGSTTFGRTPRRERRDSSGRRV